ncbi:MAG: KpsF/GutQ family sugar-phosphate isomerase [Bacteroidales bacterium]|nr:KpsF/GutQ family sugar-phosphate isomerase [Bacteroidales bacterium]
MTEIQNYARQSLTLEAEAIMGIIPQLDEQFDKAVDLMYRCTGKVVITGVGKSGHIGAKIAATLSSTGTPAFFMQTLDAFHGDLGMIAPGDVVLMISYSGQTDELLRVVPFIEHRHIPIISITGNAQSLLARHSTCHIMASVEREACPLNLAPTSSVIAALAVGDALACALIELRHFRPNDFAQFHPGGSLGRRLLTKAKDVMRTTDLPVISPTMLLGDVVIHISEGKIGLCVIVEDGKIQGIVTDGDIRRAMQHNRHRFFDTPVSAVMTRTPKCVPPDMRIIDVQDLMNRNEIHAVLVVDENGSLVGIVESFNCNV